MIILAIVLAIAALLAGIYYGNNDYTEFEPFGAVVILELLAILIFALAALINYEFTQKPDEITATPATYQNKVYKISKNKEIYTSENGITTLYPYKVEKIEYSSSLTEPQVEITTKKQYGDVNQFSWTFGERKESYKTRITKLILPEKALTEELSTAKTIIAGPTTSNDNGF